MKFLQLVSREHYETKIERTRFSAFDALSRFGQTYRSGIGWNDWRTDATATDNATRICSGLPDAALIFKPQGLVRIAELPSIRIMDFAEFREDRAWPEIGTVKPHLIVCRYADTISQHANTRARWAYIPHPADEQFFRNERPWAQRDIDLLLVGNLAPRMYPLRDKFREVIQRLTDSVRCCVHPHPGQSPLDACSGRYLRELAAVLNRASIVLTCSAARRVQLAKYVEAAACGAVVCGDMPHGADAELSEFVIPVDAEWPVDRLCATLLAALGDRAMLRQRRDAGLAYAAKHTVAAYALLLFRLICEEIKR